MYIYLHSLLLESEGVDDANSAGLFGQEADAVLLVPPPRLAKVVGPVRARAGGSHVQESPHGGVGTHTPRHRVHMCLQLEVIESTDKLP